MDVYEAIKARKSVRSFKVKDVAPEMISRAAGSGAARPLRQQPAGMALHRGVRDAGKRKELAAAAMGQKFVGEAPVVLVCCAETDNHEMACGQLCYPIDVAIAVDHITLCAVAEGLGTCWIGAFYESEVRKILGIPKPIRVVALLPVGYPEKSFPAKKNRMSLK